jgi:hypothetical protein
MAMIVLLQIMLVSLQLSVRGQETNLLIFKQRFQCLHWAKHFFCSNIIRLFGLNVLQNIVFVFCVYKFRAYKTWNCLVQPANRIPFNPSWNCLPCAKAKSLNPLLLFPFLMILNFNRVCFVKKISNLKVRWK